jgi:phosphoenolpyruvate carboxylase
VIRAFTYFSHLANLAEDRHHIRRRRAIHARAGDTQEGSIDVALSAPALGRHLAAHGGRDPGAQFCLSRC